MKFAGRKTLAKVIEVSQTGTRINDQPLIKFELEYSDHSGSTYKSEIRKLVSILDLPHVKESEKQIFYLEEDPQKIAFEEDLLQTN